MIRSFLAWEFDLHKKNEWFRLKERKARHSEGLRAHAATSLLLPPIQPIPNHLNLTVADWIAHQVKAEPYWFQKIEVLPGLFSPGWNDPSVQKLPCYGLPDDLTGMRVLDIGCAEGFFSFEAERRGAREVIGIDSFPDSIRRFNIVKAARHDPEPFVVRAQVPNITQGVPPDQAEAPWC